MRLDSIDCRKRMDSSMFGVLGTVDPDRGTHLVPVVFAVLGDELVVPIDTVKPKETTQLRRISNLRSDARASLVVDQRSDDWTELWWVRADLGFLGTEDSADGWRSRLANRYPQYRETGTVDSFLLFTIRSLSGWAAT
jgi:PPOX class probable F420-dependent enzyme